MCMKGREGGSFDVGVLAGKMKGGDNFEDNLDYLENYLTGSRRRST